MHCHEGFSQTWMGWVPSQALPCVPWVVDTKMLGKHRSVSRRQDPVPHYLNNQLFFLYHSWRRAMIFISGDPQQHTGHIQQAVHSPWDGVELRLWLETSMIRIHPASVTRNIITNASKCSNLF